MTRFVRKFSFLMALCVFCFAASAFAGEVQLTLTGADGGAYGPDDIYQYNFTSTPVPQTHPPSLYNVSLACDTYNNSIDMEETWDANVTAWANLPGSPLPLFWSSPNPGGYAPLGASSGVYGYEVAGVLAEELIADAGSNLDETNLQYALWAWFYAGALSSVPAGPDTTAVIGDITSAESLATTLAAHGGLSNIYYNGLYLFTPVPGTQPLGEGTPQEFIGMTSGGGGNSLRAPEPSALQLSGVGLLGLVLMFMFRRRDTIGNAV